MMARTLVLAGASLLLAACDAGKPAPMVGQLASDRIELRIEFGETVIARPQREGTAVRADDSLIEQDTTRIDARIREAQAALAGSEARLDELLRGPRRERIAEARANLAGAEQEFDYRELEYRRALDVFEKSLAAADSVDRAKAALNTAAARRDALLAELDALLAGTTAEELRQAEQQVEAARARLEQLQLDRERHALRAPLDARLDALLVETGERPLPGTVAAVLLGGSQPYARIYVPEPLRAAVTAGTAVRVRVDGRAETVPGTVRWVSSDPAFTPYFALTEHDRGRLSFAAKVDLDLRGSRLPDGIPVEVELAESDGAH